MKTTLNYLQAELHLDISALCGHLRNKSYPQKSEVLYSAMSSVVFYQILVDELDTLLYRHDQLIKDLKKSMVGVEFNSFGNEPESIYQHCLHYFIGDCALGTSTPELTNWVATHADRNQVLRQTVYSFFPSGDMQVEEECQFRSVSDAKKFESQTESFLRDIEVSNALDEFNQFMIKIQSMLEHEVPVTEILITLNAEGVP